MEKTFGQILDESLSISANTPSQWGDMTDDVKQRVEKAAQSVIDAYIERKHKDKNPEARNLVECGGVAGEIYANLKKENDGLRAEIDNLRSQLADAGEDSARLDYIAESGLSIYCDEQFGWVLQNSYCEAVSNGHPSPQEAIDSLIKNENINK